ncbi:9978_t:CDS:2 [Ambispora gerdemannii]|uniref:9978_t:CDS:1 n=1 Tax=Ambispora gerdemannii TaxID=144530 RepID=A0A9N9FYX5_9GLOM|nr:9978_t:CDS:2 [Ambispora gerdemannii]
MNEKIEFTEVLFIIGQSSMLILLLCLIGYWCARIGIITTTVQKGLSELIITILMPSLLFSQVGSGIDAVAIIHLWPIPVFLYLFATISGSLGLLGGKLFSFNSTETKFVTASIIFNNLTHLSMGLIQNLGTTEAMQLLLWNEQDTPEKARTRGVSYTLLATLIGNLLSLGTYLLRKEPQNEDDENNDLARALQVDEESARTAHISRKIVNEGSISESTPLLNPASSSHAKNFSTASRRVRDVISNVETIMNPPIYAAIAALIVGTNPFLKSLFFGKNAPLYPIITKSMIFLGNASTPLTLLVLGAQLSNLSRSKSGKMFSAISWVMIARFMIMPFIGISLVMMTRGWFLDDPMFWFVLMMLASGPSAINCINVTQLTGAFQEEMAALLIYSYIAVIPTLTVTVMTMFYLIHKTSTTPADLIS